MATIDTIYQISGDIAAAYAACESKNAVMPEHQGTAQLSATIESIPAGSVPGSIAWREDMVLESDDDMPDIRQILSTDTHGSEYQHRVIVLFNDNPCLSVNLQGAQYYYFSDGFEHSQASHAYSGVHEAGLIPGTHYFWAIFATNERIFTMDFRKYAGSSTSNQTSWTYNRLMNPVWVYGPEERLSAIASNFSERAMVVGDFVTANVPRGLDGRTNRAYQMSQYELTGDYDADYNSCPAYSGGVFNGTIRTMKTTEDRPFKIVAPNFHNANYALRECEPYISLKGQLSATNTYQNNHCLRHGPESIVDCEDLVAFSNTFYNCYNLVDVGMKRAELSNSQISTMYRAFYGCRNLKSIGEGMMPPSCEYFTETFRQCSALSSIPYVNTAHSKYLDYTFADCYGLEKFADNQVFDMSECTRLSGTFYDCTALATIPDFVNSSGITSLYATFYYCTSLVHAPHFDSTANVTSFNQTFQWCTSLLDCKVLDTSNAVTFNTVFSQCYALRTGPDVLDLRKLTSAPTNAFNNCVRLENLPTHLLMPENLQCSISWAQSTYIHPDTLATFDKDTDEINGGMAYNLNTVNQAVTLTFNTTLANRFTPAHRNKIVQLLQSKGYTVSSFTQNQTNGRF